jgi:putative DNA primase/helicase
MQNHHIYANTNIVAEGITAVAEETQFHPVQDYLNSVIWDKRPRITNWLIYYVGVEPDKELDEKNQQKQLRYIQAVGSKWLISAVARIFEPGCKVDTVLVFQGNEGILKSTVFSKLASADWFTDSMPDIRTRDAAIQMQGKWIVELPELSSIRGADIETVKAFLSRSTDRHRSVFGRRAQDWPRQSVFAGTTNEDQFLYDFSRARRIWTVKPGKIDIDALQHDRDQLWAEAVVRYRAGEKWWLDDDELITTAATEQAARRVGDPWENPIWDYLNTPAPGTSKPLSTTTTSAILEHALFVPRERWTRALEMRVASILKGWGWCRRQIRNGSDRGKWEYRRPEDENRGDRNLSDLF